MIGLGPGEVLTVPSIAAAMLKALDIYRTHGDVKGQSLCCIIMRFSLHRGNRLALCSAGCVETCPDGRRSAYDIIRILGS